MVGGVLYASNGVGLVEAFDPATGRTIWVQQVPESELPVGSRQPRRRVLEPGRQRAHPDVPQPVPLRAGRPHRKAGRGVRNRRPRRSHGRHGRRARLHLERDAARRPRRGGAGVVDGRAGLGRPHDRRVGRCLRLRRADRAAAVDVPSDPTRGGARHRDLGERVVALHGRRKRLGADERRRRAGLRLPADQQRHQRHVRRPPARREPVQLVDRVSRRGHGQARLALPDRAPRPVRLRQPGGADSGRHHGRRAQDQGRRPGHQAGVRLRAGSRDRPARVADRGAPGAGLDGPRRTSVADAASSLQAAGIRPPGPDGGRPDRLHAGASRGGHRDHQAVRDRSGVHPAID